LKEAHLIPEGRPKSIASGVATVYGSEAVTITLQFAVFPPSFVITVIVADPTAFAVTTPEEDTVATDVLFDDHDTVLSVAFDGVTVAVNVRVSPTYMDRDELLKLTPIAETVAEFTVTEQVAVFPPSFVFTVIVVEPDVFAVTTPEDDTVATDVLLDDQITDLSVALDGETVAVNEYVSPSVSVNEVLSRLTPVTAMTFAVTTTEQVAVLDPSFVVTVIDALPGVFAVTTPEEETVATEVLLDDHVTDLLVALEGVTVAISVSVFPSVKVNDVLFRLTPVTEITFSLTVTEQVAFLPPSFVVTVIVAVPAALAVTKPEEDTVTTVVLLEDQVTDLFVAFDGETVATKV
jgi:hypothetical protein